MDIENMKNIVILKNLPSNIVEEAFVVLKDNVKIPKEEVVNNKKNSNNDGEENLKDNGYIIKEAEMIVSQYVSKLEKSECNKKKHWGRFLL